MNARHGLRSRASAPTRVHSPAWIRLMNGESPDEVSAAWPVIGDVVETADGPLREVTFVMDAANDTDASMIHVNGTTDGHRHDIRPALFDAVPGSRVRTIAYLLPDDVIASYRFVSLPSIPADIGTTQDGWMSVHTAGVPDPRNPRHLANPLGTASSVLSLPGASEHHAWNPQSATLRTLLVEELASATMLVAEDGALPRLLVLFDAEFWERVGIRDALARHAHPPYATVLVPSGTLFERGDLLPHPARVEVLLRERVLPDVAERLGETAAADVVVAGQSYGGLAAAGVVALHPHLALTAIVQSGSFHFRAGEQIRPPGDEPGDLVGEVAGLGSRDLGGRRFVMQAGTEEANMLGMSEAFAAVAAAAGADVSLAPYRGGHDYAWWRHGLLNALEQLSG